ncbi:aminodeoxychorismate/anthranilate synthase component II [Glaciecola sp. MH2013]|uniref:aminodeoxychorismate/anthranilate synthase component II n=1 Tax=Glaciecola sp. MH2013 TaxID=2785524 RepID=UPI00189C701F|nr:aminodeoxychorismate/anthranilate synthase component II [Glaciecola sp. MH2013]MBF7073131.1 aminodeoxychorismate/anthranilate synthase component II [Glaciecola sp. MH2013]
MKNINLVLIDNVDSFTYNLVDEIRNLGLNMIIYRNTVDTETVLAKLAEFEAKGPTILMLSPGPGAPSNAGCMPELIQKVKGKFPVIGICLGHQAIVEAYGGKVARAPYVMHGKSSQMTYIKNEQTLEIFDGLSNPLSIARYHSLVAQETPTELTTIATIDNLVMAVLHEQDRMLGFQFHPESILTCDGSKLLMQSIAYLVQDPRDKKQRPTT